MTADATSALLLQWDQRRPRSRQREFGFSEIGQCRRRAGYRLAEATPTNAGASVQAILGTAIHDAVCSVFSEVAEPGDLIEHEVTFAGILGHLDRYVAAEQMVVDVKTTSSRWLEHIKLHGPDEPHLWQVSCYAAALITAGTPVKRVRIDYIARDTGEEHHWPSLDGAPFDPRRVRDALQWVKIVRDTPVDMLPRDYTPDSPFCRNCPFLDACWEGAPSQRTPLSILYVEDPDIEAWADRLWEAREQSKAAKEQEKRAKGALEAVRPFSGTGRVQAGKRTLDFRSNGIYFVAGDAPIPAVGYDEEGAA